MESTPKYKSDKFLCPHCQTIAQQKWFNSDHASTIVYGIILHISMDYRPNINEYSQTVIKVFLEHVKRKFSETLEDFIPIDFAVSTCTSCNDISLWVSQEMVYPKKTALPPPNQDMDDKISELYQEAATIYMDSPKGSAALLRLALQNLLMQIGKKGKNINSDIKELVSEGLSTKIQQALDLVRVVGNNAVHPGQIDLNDDRDTALKLFQILNFIANELITKPKELEALYNDTVPEETREHIRQRDGN